MIPFLTPIRAEAGSAEATFDGYTPIAAVLIGEFLSPRRITALGLRAEDIQLNPGVVYVAHTGYRSDLPVAQLSVRASEAAWKTAGLTVFRTAALAPAGELIVYFGVALQMPFTRTTPLFEVAATAVADVFPAQRAPGSPLGQLARPAPVAHGAQLGQLARPTPVAPPAPVAAAPMPPQRPAPPPPPPPPASVFHAYIHGQVIQVAQEDLHLLPADTPLSVDGGPWQPAPGLRVVAPAPALSRLSSNRLAVATEGERPMFEARRPVAAAPAATAAPADADRAATDWLNSPDPFQGRVVGVDQALLRQQRLGGTAGAAIDPAGGGDAVTPPDEFVTLAPATQPSLPPDTLAGL